MPGFPHITDVELDDTRQLPQRAAGGGPAAAAVVGAAPHPASHQDRLSAPEAHRAGPPGAAGEQEILAPTLKGSSRRLST